MPDQTFRRLAAVTTLMAGFFAWEAGVGADEDDGQRARPGIASSTEQLLESKLEEKGCTGEGCPVAREQLKHLWRMVRLERLAAIASTTGKPELLERLRALADQERQRHARTMVRLLRSASATGERR